MPGFGVSACVVLATLLIALNYTAGPGHHVPRPRPDHHVHRLRAVPPVGGGPAVLAGPRHPRVSHSRLRSSGRGPHRPAGLARDLTVAVLSFAFSFWLIAGAGYAAVYQGVLFLFAGIPVYVWMRGRRVTEEADA